MGFFDLSIPYTDHSPPDRSTRAKLATKALELGFTGIAYNRTIKGLMSDRDRCSIPLLTLPSLLALALSPHLSSSAAFHRHLLSLPRASPFRQYTRLTVSADSPAHTQALNSGNPVLKTYDIVAVRPMNQAAFDQACEKLEVDIIAIDFSEKLPFRLKQPLIKAAIQRKVYFEITYAGFVADVQTRRQIITNAKLLVDWTRGRNIIISSAAPTVNEFRGPLDVANLMSLLGLSMERAKAAISRNCRALLLNAVRKKHYHKEAIKVEMLPSGQESDGNKPGSSDPFDWDPISSGEGDLVLENLAKAFSNSSSKPTKTVKAKKFASVIDNTPSLGFQVNDLKSGTTGVVSQQLATRKNIHSAPQENAQSVLASGVQDQSILYDRMFEQQRFKSINHQKLSLPCGTTKAVSNVIESEDHTVTTSEANIRDENARITTEEHEVKSLVSRVSNDDDIMEIEIPTTTGAEPMNSAKSKGFTKEIHDVQSLISLTTEASNNAMEIEATMTTLVETKNVDGSIQGMHNLHGSFNVPNMPDTLTSRNSTLTNVPSAGVQQPAGSLSGGRFSSNNLPVALSQLSHGNSLGHSGVTSRGVSVVGNPGYRSSTNGIGSSIPGILPTSAAIGNRSAVPGLGVGQILGNAGHRIPSSMGNMAGGGSIGRSISSGGGLSVPGLTSRLNLSGNSGSGSINVQGQNRLIGSVLPQGSHQMISMLGNSYPTAGGPLSQSHVQVNNLSSMGMMNDVNYNDGAPLDLNDFPQLTSRPSSAGGPPGQMGSLRKQGLGVGPTVQQNQEFSIQNEDFPVFPGFKEKFKAKRKISHQVTLLPLKRLLHARSFKRTRKSKRRNMMQ